MYLCNQTLWISQYSFTNTIIRTCLILLFNLLIHLSISVTDIGKFHVSFASLLFVSMFSGNGTFVASANVTNVLTDELIHKYNYGIQMYIGEETTCTPNALL